VPNPLILAVEKIREITDPRSRQRCASALAASLRFDPSGHNPPQIMNADGIEEEFGIGKDEQDYYCIVLRRKKIRDFAHSYARLLKSADINRFFKAEAYEAYFGKTIPRLAGATPRSATVYTYAEVLHREKSGRAENGREKSGRAENGINFDLPDEVEQLFKDCKITFP